MSTIYIYIYIYIYVYYIYIYMCIYIYIYIVIKGGLETLQIHLKSPEGSPPCEQGPPASRALRVDQQINKSIHIYLYLSLSLYIYIYIYI